MASSKEILNTLLDNGSVVPQEWIDSAYGMRGLTDELAEKAFLDRYGNIYPFVDADKILTPTLPSVSNVVEMLGIQDEVKSKSNPNPRKKEQVFIEDFPKKVKDWKEKTLKNSVYGKKGWETVKKIWQQAAHEQMLSNIAKARKDAVNDGLYAWYASLMWPRAWERLENTGDFKAKDMLMDIGGNALMSIPGAGVTGLLGKAGARVAPKAVAYFSGPGRNIFEGALKGAGRMSGNILGNAFAPFGQEAMDAALYDDSDEGMEHRADFSLGDAAIGTAINQGVNRGLMRMVGPLIDRYSAGGMARGGMLKARQFLENLGQSFRTKGDKFAEGVKANLSKPVAEAGELTSGGISAARRGVTPTVETITNEERQKAVIEQAVLDAIKRGEIKMLPEDLATGGVQSDIKAELYQQILDEMQKKGPNYDYGPEMATKLSKLFNEEGVGARVGDVFDIPENIAIDLSKTTGRDVGDNVMKAVLDENAVEEAIKRNPYDFVNYATWYGDKAGGATKSERILNLLNQALPAWGVNQLGTESASDALLSQTPAIKKALKEESEKTHQAPVKRKIASEILSMVSDPGDLTAEDQLYLKAIQDNPSVMTYGMPDPDENTKFKMWLLDRGNELLRGTSVFRPSFRAE